MTEANGNVGAEVGGVAPGYGGEPPPAPRAVTSGIRSRVWNDPRVRTWWLAAVGLVLAAGWFAGERYVAWSREAELIRSGLSVDAKAFESGAGVPGRTVPQDKPVEVRYEIDGKKHTGVAMLTRSYPALRGGDTIKIRVDPNDHDVWTDRAEPAALVRQMLGAWLLLPVAGVALAVGVVRAAGLRKAWVGGPAVACLVIDHKQVATAPRSYAVRCTPAERQDKTIYTVYVPQRLGKPVRGQGIWVVARSATSSQAMAVLAE